MKTIIWLILAACIAFLPSVIFGDAAPEKIQPWERQRPTVTMQDAIRRAELYIVENHIDDSAHFISSVSYIETGSLTNSFIGKGPYWHITYELIRRAAGGQYFIIVYMDGKIGLIGGR
jgi:hypothetical protein